jgi:hypothetical protein
MNRQRDFAVLLGDRGVLWTRRRPNVRAGFDESAPNFELLRSGLLPLTHADLPTSNEKRLLKPHVREEGRCCLWRRKNGGAGMRGAHVFGWFTGGVTDIMIRAVARTFFVGGFVVWWQEVWRLEIEPSKIASWGSRLTLLQRSEIKMIGRPLWLKWSGLRS